MAPRVGSNPNVFSCVTPSYGGASRQTVEINSAQNQWSYTSADGYSVGGELLNPDHFEVAHLAAGDLVGGKLAGGSTNPDADVYKALEKAGVDLAQVGSVERRSFQDDGLPVVSGSVITVRDQPNGFIEELGEAFGLREGTSQNVLQLGFGSRTCD